MTCGDAPRNGGSASRASRQNRRFSGSTPASSPTVTPTATSLGEATPSRSPASRQTSSAMLISCMDAHREKSFGGMAAPGKLFNDRTRQRVHAAAYHIAEGIPELDAARLQSQRDRVRWQGAPQLGECEDVPQIDLVR